MAISAMPPTSSSRQRLAQQWQRLKQPEAQAAVGDHADPALLVDELAIHGFGRVCVPLRGVVLRAEDDAQRGHVVKRVPPGDRHLLVAPLQWRRRRRQRAAVLRRTAVGTRVWMQVDQRG